MLDASEDWKTIGGPTPCLSVPSASGEIDPENVSGLHPSAFLERERSPGFSCQLSPGIELLRQLFGDLSVIQGNQKHSAPGLHQPDRAIGPEPLA